MVVRSTGCVLCTEVFLVGCQADIQPTLAVHCSDQDVPCNAKFVCACMVCVCICVFVGCVCVCVCDLCMQYEVGGRMMLP